MKTNARLALCGLILVPVGCAKKTGDEQNANTALAASISSDGDAAVSDLDAGPKTEAAEPVALRRLKLIDQGREPKKVVRYSLKPGRMELLTLGLDVNVALGLDGRRKTSKAGSTTTKIQVTTEPAKNASSDSVYSFTVMSSELSKIAQDLSNLQKALDTLAGATGTASVKPNGDVHDVRFGTASSQESSGDSQAAPVINLMKELPVAFPDEPIGVGAKWQETVVHFDRSESGRLRIESTVTSTVRSIQGDVVTIDEDIVESVPDQTMTLGGVRSPAAAMGVRGKGGGRGYLVVHLDRLVADGDVTAKTAMEMTPRGRIANAQSHVITNDVTARMSLRSKLVE